MHLDVKVRDTKRDKTHSCHIELREIDKSSYEVYLNSKRIGTIAHDKRWAVQHDATHSGSGHLYPSKKEAVLVLIEKELSR